MQILNKKGELIWVLISAAPIFDKSGTVTGSIGIHMDITEQKKMQDHLLQAKLVAEKARGVEKEFLANMSHEIRTPLNSIIGMAELLSDTPLNDEQKEYLKAISHSSDILHNLITDILDISKIEAGKWVKVEQPFNLNHVLQQHLKSLELRLLEKNVTVQLVLDEKVSPSVVGEKSWLNQILLNILSNAAKFTDKGQISIETKLVRKTADIQHIQLAIHDTGIGMTDEQIKQAFQRFKQGSDAINRKYGGTGLGLAICKKLVELQGGTIEVSSMPGKGSSFNLTIPYKNAATEVREVEQHTINKKTKKDLSKYKALVVEDSPLNQQYIDKILSKWNLPHTIVENGVEALKTLKVETFDVICMDIQMPEMNGYETTKKIRSLNDKNSAVPIIALTATALIDERKKALAAGMNEHLTKPFTPQQLYAVLIKVLEGETPAEVDVKVGEQKNNAIDTSQLHLLYGEDLGFMHEMIRTFLEVTPEHIQKMKELKEKTDWDELSKVAHKCKPTFAMVGMMDAEKIVKEIEVLCKEKGSIAKLDECIALLEAQCNASSGELMNLLNQPSS
jgi:signal transduction histidine kinase/CheY-like chemotaxis protein/HPt (histidine-containing phosphotransfer) domain-containing protein